MRSPDRLRLGYVPLTDSAPLVMAKELGLFRQHGLCVELSREAGWATIRDKVLYNELDAAHALAGMVIAATLGLGSASVDCMTGLILNLHGNAITLSRRLHDRGVRDGHSLRDYIGRRRAGTPLTFASVFPSSSHHFLLRHWLVSHGIDPERDVRLVIIPPPQTANNLRAGHIDGCCVGEPWNSLAVFSGAGFCVATSASLAPRHVEKVLMVRASFAATRPFEHAALVAALREACEFCQASENRDRIVETLAQRQYLDTPGPVLQRSLSGSFDFGKGRVEAVPDFNVFSGPGVNVPTPEKAETVIDQMRFTGLIKPGMDTAKAADSFRPEILAFPPDPAETGARTATPWAPHP